MAFSRYKNRNNMFFTVYCYSNSVWSLDKDCPEAFRNSSTHSRSTEARSPWHHLCPLCRVCRLQPFLRCCFLALGCNIQQSLTWRLRSKLKGTRTGRDNRLTRTEGSECANNKPLFWYFSHASAPIYSLPPGQVSRVSIKLVPWESIP